VSSEPASIPPGTVDTTAPTPGRLVVGLVRGIHGLRGAVRLEVLSDDPARFEPGAYLFPEGTDELLTIDWAQADGPGILIRFRERPDRAAAESLRDRYLEAQVSADDRPPGSWYWHEVTGVAVTTLAGEELGRVTDIFRTGGSEVFVVEGPRGEILVPAVTSVIVEFAPTTGRIVVDGEALDLDDAEPRSRVRGRRTTRARRARELAAAAGMAGDGAAAGGSRDAGDGQAATVTADDSGAPQETDPAAT
jgi:16S rRNA processing protein RimM